MTDMNATNWVVVAEEETGGDGTVYVMQDGFASYHDAEAWVREPERCWIGIVVEIVTAQEAADLGAE